MLKDIRLQWAETGAVLDVFYVTFGSVVTHSTTSKSDNPAPKRLASKILERRATGMRQLLFAWKQSQRTFHSNRSQPLPTTLHGSCEEIHRMVAGRAEMVDLEEELACVS